MYKISQDIVENFVAMSNNEARKLTRKIIMSEVQFIETKTSS